MNMEVIRKALIRVRINDRLHRFRSDVNPVLLSDDRVGWIRVEKATDVGREQLVEPAAIAVPSLEKLPDNFRKI